MVNRFRCPAIRLVTDSGASVSRPCNSSQSWYYP